MISIKQKDENILFAQRLKEAGVEVKVAFYDNAFHGIVAMVKNWVGFQKARDISEDMITFIKENL